MLECTEPENVFKIGHLNSKSETFVPNIYYDKKSGITFTDVAGLNDTRGDLIEIVNNLVIRFLF